MERHFDVKLDDLKQQLIRMSALAETMIAEAMRVLMDRDAAIVDRLREYEKQVDRFQIDIDEMCLTLIALHQPAASDLRFIIGAVKTNAELERLADQAVTISDKALHLLEQAPLKPPEIIPRMVAIARGMLKESLHAYVNRDVQKAKSILLRDDELGDLKIQVTRELRVMMTADPTAIARGIDLLLIARNLERIGDHATNIAENAIFVAQSKDIRHHAEAGGA